MAKAAKVLVPMNVKGNTPRVKMAAKKVKYRQSIMQKELLLKEQAQVRRNHGKTKTGQPREPHTGSCYSRKSKGSSFSDHLVS